MVVGRKSLPYIANGIVIGNRAAYLETSPFAGVEFTTDATSITVGYYSNIYASYPSLAALGVYVDGVYSQSIAASATGYGEEVITVPSGTKSVGIFNGPQTGAATPTGTFLCSISHSGSSAVNRQSGTRTLVYGDSIAVGDGASPVMQKAWTLIARAADYPNMFAVEGAGYQALKNDWDTEEHQATFLARVAEYAPDTMWIAIGTNDYGVNNWSASDFGVAYAEMLDSLHFAQPDMSIYCQTPLVRSSEGANSYGSTTGDYRSQIVTAVSTRTAYATLVDGTEILTTDDLADGVHPNTAGHETYAAYVISALGLSS